MNRIAIITILGAWAFSALMFAVIYLDRPTAEAKWGMIHGKYIAPEAPGSKD